jgi:CDP-diacylglycerol--serine O-phosphatidyltransferase
MNIKKHIPNLITLLNLFSGCIALVFAIDLNFEMAFFFVSLGIFLDFFDGFFARLFKVSSPLGLQLDSLADMVTSGLVPGFVMFIMLNNYTVATDNWIAYLGFIITLGSCYRLANFNIDVRQTDSFIGLPTPANALFILSLPLVLQHTNSEIVDLVLKNQLVLLSITALSTYILNAEIPLFSLKIKEFNLIKNKLQILFLTISVLLLVAFQFLGIPLVILFYLALSVLKNREEKVINKE